MPVGAYLLSAYLATGYTTEIGILNFFNQAS